MAVEEWYEHLREESRKFMEENQRHWDERQREWDRRRIADERQRIESQIADQERDRRRIADQEWKLRMQDSDRRFYRSLNEIKVQFGMPLVDYSCDAEENRWEGTPEDTSDEAESRLQQLIASSKKTERRIQQSYERNQQSMLEYRRQCEEFWKQDELEERERNRNLQPELVAEDGVEPELVQEEQITNLSQEINPNMLLIQDPKDLQHNCESSKVIPPPLQDVVAEVASKELGKLVQLLIELIEIRLANGRTSSMIDIGLCPMEFLEPYDAHKLFVEIPREESLLQMAFVKGKICMAKEMRLIVGVDRGSPYLISFDPGGNNHCCLSVVQEIGNRDEIIGISLEEHHVRDGPIMGQSLADQEFDLKSLKNGLKLLPYDRGITSIDVIDIQLRPSMAFVFDPGKCSVVQTMEQGLKMMRRNSKSMLHHLLLVMGS